MCTSRHVGELFPTVPRETRATAELHWESARRRVKARHDQIKAAQQAAYIAKRNCWRERLSRWLIPFNH